MVMKILALMLAKGKLRLYQTSTDLDQSFAQLCLIKNGSADNCHPESPAGGASQ